MKDLLIIAGIAIVFAAGTTYVVTHLSPTVVSLGSNATPDIQSPYYTVGGDRVWKARSDSPVQATTTPCAFQSPAATSTLVSASVLLTVSSTTASIVTIAKAANAFATTTLIGSQYSIGANAMATIVASTTISSGATSDTLTFAPSQWLVFGIQGNIGTFSVSGRCRAVFQEI